MTPIYDMIIINYLLIMYFSNIGDVKMAGLEICSKTSFYGKCCFKRRPGINYFWPLVSWSTQLSSFLQRIVENMAAVCCLKGKGLIFSFFFVIFNFALIVFNSFLIWGDILVKTSRERRLLKILRLCDENVIGHSVRRCSDFRPTDNVHLMTSYRRWDSDF